MLPFSSRTESSGNQTVISFLLHEMNLVLYFTPVWDFHFCQINHLRLLLSTINSVVVEVCSRKVDFILAVGFCLKKTKE